jgi:hypothetical protein
MPYKICQFNLTHSLLGIPANRAFNPTGIDSVFIFPEGKNVIIKKICLDCVYNQSGDLLIKDYSLGIYFFNYNDIQISNFNPIVINPNNITQIPNISAFLNKQNTFLDCDIIAGGFSMTGTNRRSNKIVLSNTITPITSNISYLLTVYYENM